MLTSIYSWTLFNHSLFFTTIEALLDFGELGFGSNDNSSPRRLH